MKVEIKGFVAHFYGKKRPQCPLTINGTNFSRLSVAQHKRLIEKMAPRNYSPIPGWVVVGVGEGDVTLLIRRIKKRKVETKEVLDFQTMYSVNNFGYKLFKGVIGEEILELLESEFPSIPRAMDHVFHAPALSAIKAFTGMDMVLMKSGGTESVETAANIASQFWHQKYGFVNNTVPGPYFISAENCFHGRSRFTRSLSSSELAREGFAPFVPYVERVPFGDTEALYRKLQSLRYLVAAVILEPIQGEGGVIMPPHRYLERVRELCNEFDVPLILDEIQTGFGRTGYDWAFENENMRPDLLLGGKAAGGGFVPVSFVAGTKKLMSCIKPGTEGATWSASPIQCVAVIQAIRVLSDNNLSERSHEMGEFLMSLLEHTREKFPKSIVDVRGQGLFVGIETVHDGKKLSQALLEEGVWAKETGKGDKTLRFSPPLVITPEQIKDAVLALERALKKLEDGNA